MLKQRVCDDIIISPVTPHFQVVMPTSDGGTITPLKCLQCFRVPKSDGSVLKV